MLHPFPTSSPTPSPTTTIPTLRRPFRSLGRRLERFPTAFRTPRSRLGPTSDLPFAPTRHPHLSRKGAFDRRQWLGAEFPPSTGGAPSGPVASAACQRRDVTAHYHVITAPDVAGRRRAYIPDTVVSVGREHRDQGCRRRIMPTSLWRVARL